MTPKHPDARLSEPEDPVLRDLTGAPLQEGAEAAPADGPLVDGPVFDRAEEGPPLQGEEALPVDAEGNLLPGNDPLDDDPDDNGPGEQNDPETQRRKLILGDPIRE